MNRTIIRIACIACCLFTATSPLERICAQDSLPPWKGGITASLGQPVYTQLYAGVSGGLDYRSRHSSPATFHSVFGIARPLFNPVAGVANVALETYGGLRSAAFDGGVRALFQMPVLRLTLGADYNVPDEKVGFVAAYTTPVRRGGVFGAGSVLRTEWSSKGIGALRAAVLVPLKNPAAGRTRPRKSQVDYAPRKSQVTAPPASKADLDSVLTNVRIAADRIRELVVPFFERGGDDPRAAVAPMVAALRKRVPLQITGSGLAVDAIVGEYHAELARVFSIAASGRFIPHGTTTPAGDSATAIAKAVVLEHVLYPYNRLLGQWKTEPTLTALTAYARGNFARDILEGARPNAEREQALLYVFEQWVDIILAIERRERAEWRDSRVVWLPLQLALRPDEHDTQAELDSIIEAAAGAQFADGNRIWYLVNQELEQEVFRSIGAARNYHVVWIHDFRGRNAAGQPDAVAFRFVTDAYFKALIDNVKAYDTRRRLPVYMIFVDQVYYNVNHSRMWFDVLENPLTAKVRLPPGSEALAATIRERQLELAAAVAGSHLLQAEARQYGDAWLRNQVKVHISVTNPADHSFWTRQILPVIGIPDNVMRDHRKIIFYDVSEDDPYAGAALYTGMGIGEHYVGPHWEDRSLMVQGPAILSLKAQARQLLLSQGLTAEQIPYPLRARGLAPGYRDRVRSEIDSLRYIGARDQRALELHNQTGFSDKQVSVARAVLYSMMPPGSVIKTPDSLWGSTLFAALLTGSALRGCRVLVIAPALAAAPSSGPPQMALAHDLLARLIVIQQELGAELNAVDGLLKTGIYNPAIRDVGIEGRIKAAYANARRTPFLRRLYPTHELVDTAIRRITVQPPSIKAAATVRTDRKLIPKLHLKANFFASREAWDNLIARVELLEVMQAYMAMVTRRDTTEFVARRPRGDLEVASDKLQAAFRDVVPDVERDRLIYYALIGSANADYRSMFMDGEASVLLSGWSGVVALIDFTLIANLSVWVDDLEMLDALLPQPSHLLRRVAWQARHGL